MKGGKFINEVEISRNPLYDFDYLITDIPCKVGHTGEFEK